MLLYAITSRNLLPGTEQERCASLIALVRGWGRGGVDYIQIREKDLPAPDLLALSRKIVTAVREESPVPRILVNGPAEIALAAKADGVHLPASAPAHAADLARQAFQSAGRECIISRSCHSLEEIRAADTPSLLVFAPVFEKIMEQESRPGVGLHALKEACHAAAPTPVIALGGITAANAPACIGAGAAGVAGIRLFLGHEWRTLPHSDFDFLAGSGRM